MCVCECRGCFAFLELSVRVLVVFGVSCWVLSGFPYDDVGSSSLSELSSSRAVLAIRVFFRRLVVRCHERLSFVSYKKGRLRLRINEMIPRGLGTFVFVIV